MRGRKPVTHNVCRRCGVSFERWRCSCGTWTNSKYCSKCRNNVRNPRHEFVRMNVLRLRRNNPCATLQEIGDRFDITRERVRQILSRENKPTAAFHQTYLCLNCGIDIGIKSKRFCSPKCRHDYQLVKIACSCCGQLKEHRISELVWQIKHNQRSTDLFFCSKHCQGKWLGENHGVGVHPENRPIPKKK